MALGAELRKARIAGKFTPSQIAAGTQMSVQFVEALEQEDFSKMPAPIYAKGFIRLYAEFVGLDAAPLVDEYIRRFIDGEPPPSLSAVSEPVPTPVPEVAPPVETVETVEPVAEEEEPEPPQEPDLFSQPRDEPAAEAVDEPAPAVPAGKRSAMGDALAGMRSTTVRLAGACAERVRQLVGLAQQKTRAVRDSLQSTGERLGDARLADSPWKSVSIILGVLIVLVFVISGLSRCVRRPDRGLGHLEETRKALRLAVEPPEPYVD